MPTIDELAPATAAADTDEHIVSQAGTALKMTRAQILAGVQPQLALASGVLLGRSSAGAGAPESLTVGANLTLAGGTLSALAVPYMINALPMGTVPASGDLIPFGQAGTNVAVPYSQFLSGLPGVVGLDASQMLIRATGSTTGARLADFAAGTLPLTGGALTGILSLSADPTSALQAATKHYVDSQCATSLPLVGGILTGPVTLSGDPATALQAAPKQYVDGEIATALPISGGTLTGLLTLAAAPMNPLNAATKQ